jgi:multidrug efflux system membrane fusion protein
LLANAKVDLTRYQGLVAEDSIAKQQLDTQVALVEQYEGTVVGDEAQVATARLNLQYAHIVSPVSGRVGLRQVDAGNYVTPADTNGLVVVTQLQPITVIFPVPEDNVRTISGACTRARA